MTDITKFNRNGAIRNIGDEKVRNSIAPSFSTGTDYYINDLCMYDGALYKCTTSQSTGDWNSNNFTTTTIDNNFVKKTGDTLIGSIRFENAVWNIKNSNMDTSTSISTNQYTAMGVFDVNNRYAGYIQSAQYTDGTVNMQLGARRYSNNANVDNILNLRISADNTKSVIADSNLFVKHASIPQVTVQNSNLTFGTAPSSDTSIGSFRFSDKNDNQISYIVASYLQNGGTRSSFVLRQKQDNDYIYNMISLNFDNSGTASVQLSHPSAWRTALELEDSGNKSLTDNTKFTGTIRYRKIGSILRVWSAYGAIKLANALTSASVSLATLPTGYRPSENSYYICGNTTNIGMIYIGSDGNITFWKSTDVSTWETSMNIYFNVVVFL